MTEWIPRLFGLEILLSAISAFGRPDYNLPLFIFALMIWDFPKSQHTRVIYLLMFSCCVDLIYLIFWGVLWNSKLFIEYSYDNTVHQVVIYTSIATLVVKLGIIVLSILNDDEVKENMKVGAISHNIVQFFTFSNNTD